MIFFDDNIELIILETASAFNINYNDLYHFILLNKNKHINITFFDELSNFLFNKNIKPDDFVRNLEIFFREYEELSFSLEKINYYFRNLNKSLKLSIKTSSKTDFY